MDPAGAKYHVVFDKEIGRAPEMMSREQWWDYLMIFIIEPALAENGPEFIIDYPPSQAALAESSSAKTGCAGLAVSSFSSTTSNSATGIPN